MITDGVAQTGEVSSWAMRERVVAPDYSNAWKAGAKYALDSVSAWIDSKRSVSGPYDDIRALEDLQLQLADMIRLIHAKATEMEG
jgi:hypothetical protein